VETRNQSWESQQPKFRLHSSRPIHPPTDLQVLICKFANLQICKFSFLVGIDVHITEESYTSKCSFLDSEPLGKQEVYQGKRIHRGLFRSALGLKLNADINGSANLIRKAFPNAFADGIQAVVVRPVRVTPYKVAI